MAYRQGFPAHICPDQRCVDMNDLAGCDLGCDARRHRAFENGAKALGAPALANARQRRMVGKHLVQTVTREPTDRDVDLGFA
jgi:hypothetical protein